MHQATANTSKKAQQPQYQKHDDNCPQHGKALFHDITGDSLLTVPADLSYVQPVSKNAGKRRRKFAARLLQNSHSQTFNGVSVLFQLLWEPKCATDSTPVTTLNGFR